MIGAAARRLLLALIPLLLAAQGAPAQAPDLYEVQVPVTDEGNSTRRQALHSAMRILLTRLAGARDALAPGQLQEFLREVDRYVLRYRYQSAPGDAAQEYNYLFVSFDQATLDQRLREQNIAIWGRQRPAVLVWLLVSEPAGAQMLNREEPGHARHLRALDEQARVRGITLVYPLLDLSEAEQVRSSDVRGGFAGPILQASRRYGPDVVLHGVLEQAQTGRWQLRWQTVYMEEGEQQAQRWSRAGSGAAALLREGIDRLSDSLAAHYLPRGAPGQQQQQLSLIVHGVENLSQYATLRRYLKTLNSVVAVHPARFQGHTVSFTLRSTGDEGVIKRAISLGRQLKAAPDGNGLEYTWRALPQAR